MRVTVKRLIMASVAGSMLTVATPDDRAAIHDETVATDGQRRNA